ncbi:hypothetical protein FJT64_004481 [Amphibalanus amphitrite]|uniref:Uncharacterized protein n=1 Tax=Amphibalanus amphitrite TaxID=1232801 RepID=A0A6A4W3B8_AMPAM|nr:hypothetical protein FJT64_004481 [Amphibalanus amphitrite]
MFARVQAIEFRVSNVSQILNMMRIQGGRLFSWGGLKGTRARTGQFLLRLVKAKSVSKWTLVQMLTSCLSSSMSRWCMKPDLLPTSRQLTSVGGALDVLGVFSATIKYKQNDVSDYVCGVIGSLPVSDHRLEEIRVLQERDDDICRVTQQTLHGWMEGPRALPGLLQRPA